MNVFMVSLIPGFMVGFEWDYENYFVVIDLGIIRFVWDYYGYPREDVEGEDKD